MQFSVYGVMEIYNGAVAIETVLGRDRLVTSRRRILLPRKRNFDGKLIKNLGLLYTKLYILGIVVFLSVPTKNIFDIIMF